MLLTVFNFAETTKENNPNLQMSSELPFTELPLLKRPILGDLQPPYLIDSSYHVERAMLYPLFKYRLKFQNLSYKVSSNSMS